MYSITIDFSTADLEENDFSLESVANDLLLLSIVGTAKSDQLKGTDIGETIAGDTLDRLNNQERGGNDTIRGGGGFDIIYGDAAFRIGDSARGGNDQILGGNQRDFLRGDTRILSDHAKGGNDSIWGGSGDDIVEGDALAMFVNAQGGNDQIWGEAGNDNLRGDAQEMRGSAQGGNDVIDGGAGDDFVFGDSVLMFDNTVGGNDILIGGTGNDSLFGDSSPFQTRNGGQDTLIGVDPNSENPGFGEFDALTGNGGSDVFVLGDEQAAYYLGQGDIDHAAIFDFSLLDGDVIQLQGDAADYVLQNFTVGSLSGVAIALQETGDLIGAVINLSTAELSLANVSAFRFVN